MSNKTVQYWYIDSDGKTSGPADEELLMHLLGKGEITGDTDIAVFGEQNWSSLSSTLETEDFRKKTCPFCRTRIDKPKPCPSCGTPHHHECWEENKGCTVYGCSEAPADEPTIVITNESNAPSPIESAPFVSRRQLTTINYNLNNRFDSFLASENDSPTVATSPSNYLTAIRTKGIGRMLFMAICLGLLIIRLAFPESAPLLRLFMAASNALRLKNTGVSPWLCLLSLIPFLDLYLVFFCLIAQERWMDTKKLDSLGKFLCAIMGVTILALFYGLVLL